jgi:hypothetical protein
MEKEHSIDDNKVKYINYCINAFARQYDMSLLESFNYMEGWRFWMNAMQQSICYL